MATKDKASKLELQVQADKVVISADKECTRIIEISITPPSPEKQGERAPLNLALVLDRSGSMQGEKLHFVKQAAAHVVNLLGKKDRLSVTVYDDRVETIFPARMMADEIKTKAVSSIQNVRSGSSTFLAGGWLKGCEDVAGGITDNTVNRTLLLTDGLANVGMRNPRELAAHAREIYLRGVTTSCFGVGVGYDEHLLEAMSNFGGGNFYFLETLEAIPLVFEREFDELIHVAIRDCEISLHLPQGVRVEVSAGYHMETKNGRTTISLGSLYAGKNVKVYLQAFFEKDISDKELIFPVIVRGKGDGEYLFEERQSLTFKVLPSAEENEVEQDQALMERFALVDMADKANEALKREREGDRLGASVLMQESSDRYQNNLSDVMYKKYSRMSSDMSQGMSEMERKRYHREEYQNRRGQSRVREYRLMMVNGHLIARIEYLSVLIDSGLPISVGREKEWYFFNEVHTLSQEYMGVTLDYVSKMVGAPVDIMLGTDILKKHHVTFMVQNRIIAFSEQLIFNPEINVPMTNFMGVPIVEVNLGGQTCPMYVDTGAKLSYIDESLAKKFTLIGKEMDFYPGVGEFETPVYQVALQLGGEDISLRCGVLPKILEMTLGVTGKKGIIGSELFEKGQVDLAFPENMLYMVIR